MELRKVPEVDDDWITDKQPLLVVPKTVDEVRIVCDCTQTGLNESLSPWSMDLPKFIHFAMMV